MGLLSKFITYLGYGTATTNAVDGALTLEEDALSRLNFGVQVTASIAGFKAEVSPAPAIVAGYLAMDVSFTKMAFDLKHGKGADKVAGDIAQIFGNGLVIAAGMFSFMGLKPLALPLSAAGVALDVTGIALNHPDKAKEYTRQVLDTASSTGSSALHAIGKFLDNTFNSLWDYLEIGIFDPRADIKRSVDRYLPTVSDAAGISLIRAQATEAINNPAIEWADKANIKHGFVSGEIGNLYVDHNAITFAANTTGNVHGPGNTLLLTPDSGSYAGVFGTAVSVSGIYGSSNINVGGVGSSVTAYGANGVGGYVGLVADNQTLKLMNEGFTVATAPNVKNLNLYGDRSTFTFAANTTGTVSGNFNHVVYNTSSEVKIVGIGTKFDAKDNNGNLLNRSIINLDNTKDSTAFDIHNNFDYATYTNH